MSSAAPPVLHRLLALALVLLLAGSSTVAAAAADTAAGTAEDTAGDGAVWPDTMATVPDRTVSVERSPVGAAAIAYTVGTTEGPRPGGTPLVLAASEDVYRTVDEAAARSTSADRGRPAPMLLSPDGRTLAVGARHRNGTIALIDLGTGEKREASLSYVTSGIPVAFDPQGRWLWVRARAAAPNDSGSTTFDDWEWQRVDLEDATAIRVHSFDRAMGLTVVPDGEEVLVKASQSQAQRFSTETLEKVGDPISLSGDLGAAAVSPDGERVVTSGRDTVRITSLTDPDAEPERIEVEGDLAVHSWLDDETVLVTSTAEDGTWRLDELDLATRAITPVTTLTPEDGQTVLEASIATDLSTPVQTREAGDPDHGASGWLPWTVGGLALAALAGLAFVLRRVSRRGAAAAARG